MSALEFLEWLRQWHFSRPELLWLVWLLPFIYWLAGKIVSRNQWSGWIAEPMLSLLMPQKPRSSSLKKILLMLFFLCGIVAISGPALEKQKQPLSQSPPSIYFVVDLSLSMLAEDEKPNRIGLVNFKLTDILNHHADAIAALIVYAGSAHRVIPLTEHHQTIIHQLPALNPEIMPAMGSNPQQAMDLVSQSANDLNLKKATVIWFTDETSDEQIQYISDQLKRQRLNLQLISVGSEEGDIIPLSTGRPLQDSMGQFVVPQVPIQAMRQAAKAANIGFYEAQNLQAVDLDVLLEDRLQNANSDTNSDTHSTAETWKELGYLMIMPMLLALLPLLRRQALLWLLLFNVPVWLSLLLILPAQANWKNWWLTPDQQGQQLFQQQHYDQAQNTFMNPAWRIASQFRAQEYEQAAMNYQRLNDFYNAGNAYAHAGQFPQAIAAYDKAIELNPEDEQARHNKHILEQFMQSQQQQQQQQQQQESGEGEQQQDASSQSSSTDNPSSTNSQQNPSDQAPNENNPSENDPQNQQSETQQSNTDQANSDQSSPDDSNPGDSNPDDSSPGKSNQGESTEPDQQPADDDLQSDDSHLQQADSISTQTREALRQQMQQALEDAQQHSTSTNQPPRQPLTAEQIQEIEEAMQFKQWLRAVPDNPSLLLQRKFDHQYQQQRQRQPAYNAKPW